MKKQLLSLLLCLVMIFSLISCAKDEISNPWANAVYTENTDFGEGAKTVTVTVNVEENSVVWTLKTDAETLGEALLEHGLISGDESEFGLYVKVVNGITADYDIDASYWSFTQNGEYMMTGVDGTAISDGDRYELTYTK